MVRQRRFWWEHWLRSRLLICLAMVSVALVSVPVIATQRPRPSYLFPLSLCLMAVTGWSLVVIFHRFTIVKRLAPLMPAVMVGLCLLVPSYYANPDRQQARRLYETTGSLLPHQALIADTDTRFLKGEYCSEVSFYLGHGACQSYSYAVLEEKPPDQSLEAFLTERGINLIYM